MNNEAEEPIENSPTQPVECLLPNETCNVHYCRKNMTKLMSIVDAFVVFLKGTIGTGIFMMPYAFSRVGLLFGIFILISMGFLITKSLQLFLRVHRATCTRRGKSTLMYDEMVEVTLKNMDIRIPKLLIELATYFTNALLVFYYVGVSSICVDFIGDVIREMLKFEDTNNSARYTILFFPFFMMLNLCEHLRDMSIKSMAGNILILNVIIIGLAYAFERETTDTWTVLSNDYFMYPRFIGIMLYSLSSPGLVLAVVHTTNNPEDDIKFNKVLERGMILIISLHLLVGIFGYLKWGSNVSENFIRDIQNDPNGYTLLALIMQALAIYLTYGVQCYVPISIFLKQYAIPAIEYETCKGTLYLWELIVRFAVTLVSCMLPMIIPRLRSRVALLGLMCNVILTFLLPLTLHMLLYIKDLQESARRNWKVVTGISCIILISILTLCCFSIDLLLTFKH